MDKIAYIGCSQRMLENLIINNKFCLTKVVYIDKRIDEVFKNILIEHNIEYIAVNEKKDIGLLDQFLDDVEYVLMYKFDFILPQKLVDKKRIFNFHGGSLRTNRGAHAVVWSILNMEKTAVLSLYELTGAIDAGWLIAEYCVEVDFKETVSALNSKLQEGIPELLLHLNEYLSGQRKATLIENGVYRPKVSKEDYTIDIDTMPLRKIDAILRSQADYFGAVVKMLNEEYRILKWTWNKVSECGGGGVKRRCCQSNDSIYIEENGEKLVLFLHTK